MKNMKKKLMASVAMLVVSAIMMTSTSYAWYTINTKATAGNVSVTLAQTKNVEIAKAKINSVNQKFIVPEEVTAKDAPSQFKFGAQVAFSLGERTELDLPAAVVTSTNKESLKAKAYSTVAEDDAYPQEFAEGDVLGAVYSSEGRTNGFVKTTKTQDTESGIVTYTYPYLESELTNESAKTAKVAFSYNMFIRTNIAGNIVMGYTLPEGASEKATVDVQYAEIGKIISEGTASTDGVVAGADIDSYTLSTATAATDIEKAAFTDGKKFFAAKANTVYLVQIFCYFDGDKVIAEDLTAGKLDATLQSLTFYNLAIPEAAQSWETSGSSATAPSLEVAGGKFVGMTSGKTYFFKAESPEWTQVNGNEVQITATGEVKVVEAANASAAITAAQTATNVQTIIVEDSDLATT